MRQPPGKALLVPAIGVTGGWQLDHAMVGHSAGPFATKGGRQRSLRVRVATAGSPAAAATACARSTAKCRTARESKHKTARESPLVARRRPHDPRRSAALFLPGISDQFAIGRPERRVTVAGPTTAVPAGGCRSGKARDLPRDDSLASDQPLRLSVERIDASDDAEPSQ